MRVFYGNKVLPISGNDSDILLQNISARILQDSSNHLTGIPLQTIEETKHRMDVGFVLLGNVDKTTLIGVGFIDGKGGRFWIYKDEDATRMFIDGFGSVVENLGLTFDATTNTIHCPFNGIDLYTF